MTENERYAVVESILDYIEARRDSTPMTPTEARAFYNLLIAELQERKREVS